MVRAWRSAWLVETWLGSGVAVDAAHLRADALDGAVAALGLGRLAGDFNEHCVIDIRPERPFHGLQVRLVAVRGQLDVPAQPTDQIAHEGAGRARIPRADREREDELGVGVDGRPVPHVAVAKLAPVFLGDILLLGVAERPDFIALEATAGVQYARSETTTLPQRPANPASRPALTPAILEFWREREPRIDAPKSKWKSWLQFLDAALDLGSDDDDPRA